VRFVGRIEKQPTLCLVYRRIIMSQHRHQQQLPRLPLLLPSTSCGADVSTFCKHRAAAHASSASPACQTRMQNRYLGLGQLLHGPDSLFLLVAMRVPTATSRSRRASSRCVTVATPAMPWTTKPNGTSGSSASNYSNATRTRHSPTISRRSPRRTRSRMSR
jgi:hypothetical protein